MPEEGLSSRYCSITERTDAGNPGLASMRFVVLADNRPSLCLALTIVQAVLRLIPRAFACASSDVYPAAIKASPICWYRTVSRRVPDVEPLRSNTSCGFLLIQVVRG